MLLNREEKLKMAIFCGGRGSVNIIRTLLVHQQIELTIIVNTYDDGLSTGRLRRLIPGMLGPSDVRKNISTLMDFNGDRSIQALKSLLEYRLPEDIDFNQAVAYLDSLFDSNHSSSLLSVIAHLNLKQVNKLKEFLSAFKNYYRFNLNSDFDFSDCSLGNIFFAGCYLLNDSNFNKSVEQFAKLCELRGRVLNVTDGENLVLVALKEDGCYIADEASLVSKQNDSPIKEIFLLSNYLSFEEESYLLGLNSIEEKVNYLRKKSKYPKINPEVQQALRDVDVIVYGPGTQHSSLFPSYLTSGVAEAIMENKSAEKVFISNILKDHEIQSENVGTLISKFIYYLSRKGSLRSISNIEFAWDDFVSTFFVQISNQNQNQNQNQNNDIQYVKFDTDSFPSPIPLEKVLLKDWRNSKLGHLGGQVVNELISIANTRLNRKVKRHHYMVSIIVPCLNESKTLGKVLQQLKLLNLEELGVSKEIIFVDGGSTDGSYQLAIREKDIVSYQLPKTKAYGYGSGRGAALRFGVDQAKGNIILFFPCDNEYDVDDVIPMLSAIINNEFKVVFGGRSVKCLNLDDRIRGIYQRDYLGYFVSKYGGMLLSILGLLLYNRFVSDPLTGLKAFDSHLLKEFSLRSNGLELESEIMAKLSMRKIFIFEYPVNYKARTKKDGKKTKVRDGFRALIVMITMKLRRC
ncbi:MAG: YvcK family protein [Oligoflexia bacterium]|nr:YvcK family protein [Oligoflexia bacterium]